MELIDKNQLKEILIEEKSMYIQPIAKAVISACISEVVTSHVISDVLPVVHAKWIEKRLYDCAWVGRCSQRGEYRYVDKFCPNCGAKMDAE